MSSLTGKTSAELDETIANTGFWPDVPLRAFVENYRLPAEYISELLQHEMQLALTRINTALAPIADAFNDYSDIDQEHFGSDEGAEGDIYLHYVRAVHTFARANLAPLFVTLNRQEPADKAHEEWGLTMDYWLRESARSIAYIKQRLAPMTHNPATDTLQTDGYTVAVL